MSYGRSFPTVYVPLTFVCESCAITVTVQVDAGKDYIYEDTCREGERYMIDCCNWLLRRSTSTVLCADCRHHDSEKGMP